VAGRFDPPELDKPSLPKYPVRRGERKDTSVFGTILFYFDFMSPYAYLGSIGVERLANKHRLAVDWRPTLLGISVIKVMGLKAVADTPLKRDYVCRDVVRSAKYLDIPFHRASIRPMAPLAAARAFVWLKQSDPVLAQRFATEVFRAQWARGQDMSMPDAVASLAPCIGVDPAVLREAIDDDGTKRLLRHAVDKAMSAGVFGTPTFIAGGEMFWGTDRLPMLDRWLETGGW
jgi:2-hydroxychromene-2-carboxylate isomerase